jgi:hypothetical protein
LATAVCIDPKREDIATGIQIKAGCWYLFTCQPLLDDAGRPYADKEPALLPATADGSYGLVSRVFHFIAAERLASARQPHNRLRVRRVENGTPATFMQLFGCIGDSRKVPNLENEAFIIGSCRVWKAPKSGRLHVFVNDWPNTSQVPLGEGTPYSNNCGALWLTVTALDVATTPVRLP